MPIVQMPDGSTVQFPDGMAPADMQHQIETHMASHPAARNNSTPQQGFFGSFSDSSGLSMIGRALAHPIDTAGNVAGAVNQVFNPTAATSTTNPIINGISSMVDNTTRNVRAARDAYKAGSKAGVLSHLVSAIPIVGPAMDQATDQYADGNYGGEAGTLMGTVSGLAAPKLLGKVGAAVRNVPETAVNIGRGGGLDTPGVDGITPRQQYAIAKSQGVNLDTAQATGSQALAMAKKVTNATIGGAPAYADNFQRNVNALQMHAETLPDTASPMDMPREQFGTVAKTRLLEDQEAQNQKAGKLYDDLSNRVGTVQPSVANIQDQARQIVSENKSYYDKHPEMMKGGAGQAWRVVNNLAAEPTVPEAVPSPVDDGGASWNSARPKAPTAAAAPIVTDTWSDLHKLRTDLMDMTRGPEFIGDRATGWIKQMTSSVDKSMSETGSGLSGEDSLIWRTANEIYGKMKQTYDNPLSKLYHVVRAPDGLSAANLLANITPDVARQLGEAAPDLVPQLQRQTIMRVLDPAGNVAAGTGTFDLKNLPSRFLRAQKEQLAGVLNPEQITNLDNLAKTSRQVYSTDNPSGTAWKAIPAAELLSAGGSLRNAALDLSAGNPIGAAVSVAAPVAWYGATRMVGKALNSPAFTDRLMETPRPPAVAAAPEIGRYAPVAGAIDTQQQRGEPAWAALGAGKLQDHIARAGANAGITADQIDALGSTPQGKSLLVQASDLAPGSAAMTDLVKQISAITK